MPDIGDRLAFSRAEGTVAFASVDGKPVFGVNSDAPGYTVADGAAARIMRDRLVTEYPDVMNTDGISWKPNDVVYHAEATALMRAAEPLGGSLAGRTIDIGVDRGLCPSCDAALPYIGLQLGNPTVRITDTTGAKWVMRDGVWIQRGRQ